MEYLTIVSTINISPYKSYGQLTMEHQGKEPAPPTAEAYDISQYGQIGNTLYTGSVSLNVPFYTYKLFERSEFCCLIAIAKYNSQAEISVIAEKLPERYSVKIYRA